MCCRKVFQVHPKAPERTPWFPSVDSRAVNEARLRSSCRRMSGWDHPTHGVKNRDTEHSGDVGGVLSDLLGGLVIIVGVEVSEVCVGVGLPGQLGVEVLVSFLQDQVVFVESLLVRWMEREGQLSGPMACLPEPNGEARSKIQPA